MNKTKDNTLSIGESLALKVSELFDELDERIKMFKRKAEIDCPENCGHCCLKQDIETTILEFFPLAVHLWKTGEAEKWMDKITQAQDTTCVFYVPGENDPEAGRCGCYKYRGLLCRLFGFFAYNKKNNKPAFVACSIMKKKYPEKVSTIQNLIENGLDIPFAGRYSYRLAMIDSFLGTKFFPVNEAIYKALEKVGFYLYMSERKEKPHE